MPFKDTKEGQTHFQNDGCGESEHNDRAILTPQPYNKRDHYHCFQSDNPPCGIKGKHRCCLCEEEVPSRSFDDLVGELVRDMTLVAPTPMAKSEVRRRLNEIIEIALHTQRTLLKEKIVPKESKKHYLTVEGRHYDKGFNKCREIILANLQKYE